MKDAIRAIRKAYETALDNIVVNGKQIPFYDLVPETGKPEYVYIESINSEESGDKSEFGQTVDIKLIAVSEYQGSYGRIENTEDIGEKVMDTIKSDITSTLDLSGDGFYMITSEMTGTLLKLNNQKGKKTINREINFRHFVGQN